MSRSCQSGWFSKAGLGVAAQEPGQAGDPLGQDRVALVGHRRAALLAGPERLLELADLGVLEVPDLGREALQGAAGDGDRGEQRRVAVALDDLGRDRVDGAGRDRPAPPPRDPGRGGCTCRPGPEILPVAISSTAAASRVRSRSSSKAQPASFSPSVVGSACTEWVRPIITVPASARARATRAAMSASQSATRRSAGGLELQGQGRVDDVAAGQAEVEVAALRARPSRRPG